MDMFSTTTLAAPTEESEGGLLAGMNGKAAGTTEDKQEDQLAPGEVELAAEQPEGAAQQDEGEAGSDGEEADGDDAAETGEEEASEEEKEEEDDAAADETTSAAPAKPGAKKKEKPPRLPYAWGLCPTIVTIRLAPAEEGRQKVRMAVTTHENPMEPPVFRNFEVSAVPPGLHEEFLNAVRDNLAAAVATVIAEFPDRQKTWEIAPDDAEKHITDYTPTTAKKKGEAAIKGKAGAKPAAKKAPPELPKSEGQVSLF